MNLNFTTVSETETHYVQRADVSTERKFWWYWKAAGPDSSLKKCLQVRPDVAGGRRKFFAYRMYPKNAEPAGLPAVDHIPYAIRDASGLLPYQPQAVGALCKAVLAHNAAVDGSDTGIGKTYHALAVCRELGLRPGVVCKLAGIATWRRTCAAMGLVPVFIVNWEHAKGASFRYVKRARSEWTGRWEYGWVLPPGVMLIFDECHLASNPDTANNALWIASRGHASVSCSATLADRPSRLEGLFRLLGIADETGFRNWLEKMGRIPAPTGDMEQVDNVVDMATAHRVLYPRFGVRVSYHDPEVAKHFPQARIMVDIVSMEPELTRLQNARYADLLQKVEHYRALGSQAEALVADLRYRQETELYKVGYLVESVRDTIREGGSALVFVNFRETLAALAGELKTRSLVFGDQERMGVDRDAVIDDFQAGRSRMILLMTNAGGASISLHDLDGRFPRVSYICPTYDPVQILQVLGRTRRAGSKTIPVCRLVYAADTVEEKVADTVNRKIDAIEALNRGDLMEPDLFGLDRRDT